MCTYTHTCARTHMCTQCTHTCTQTYTRTHTLQWHERKCFSPLVSILYLRCAHIHRVAMFFSCFCHWVCLCSLTVARSQNLTWGWPGCAALSQGALVTALMGMIVFKTDRRSHIPGQDRRLRSPTEAALWQVLKQGFKATGTQTFPSRGECVPPTPNTR